MYRIYFKRIIDFSLAFILLVFISPIFLLICIGLFFSNSGKVFFIQKRPGKDEKIFSIVKFKTMNDNKDTKGNLLPDAKRLTKIGKKVREASLDELPQLINVLIGDMSLIGPRPLLVQYLSLYNDEQRRRHNVRPGITGWAQVNGRNTLSWEKKFKYDVWYVDNLNVLLDMKILFLTLKKVFLKEGISSKDSVTMEEFKGSN